MSHFTDIDQHKRLFSLAIPMILSNITVPLLGLVDTAVIGHLDHAYYLGGSTVGAMVITFITWLCGFLRMSTTGLSAQAFGAQDSEQGLLILCRGLIVASAIGLFFIVFQGLYIDGALWLAGGSKEVQLYAGQYSEIRIWGLPAALGNLVLLGWLLGNHKAKTVMWLLVVTNGVNLSLDLLFVLVFDWKVQGVAWATLIAEYSGLLLGLTFVLRNYRDGFSALGQHLNHFYTRLIELEGLSRYFKLNRDILLRTLCLEICFVFITFQGARLGDDIVAANAILMNFLLLISFGLDGIANAAEAMVGQAKGAKNKTQLFATVKLSLIWTGIFALAYSSGFYLLGQQFIYLITDIESVVLVASEYLPWMILLPVISCWCFLFDGVYIGLMQAKAMRNSMIVATFACFFPMWLAFQSFGNHGLWAAFSCFMLSRGIVLAWHYQKHKLSFV